MKYKIEWYIGSDSMGITYKDFGSDEECGTWCDFHSDGFNYWFDVVEEEKRSGYRFTELPADIQDTAINEFIEHFDEWDVLHEDMHEWDGLDVIHEIRCQGALFTEDGKLDFESMNELNNSTGLVEY